MTFVGLLHNLFTNMIQNMIGKNVSSMLMKLYILCSGLWWPGISLMLMSFHSSPDFLHQLGNFCKGQFLFVHAAFSQTYAEHMVAPYVCSSSRVVQGVLPVYMCVHPPGWCGGTPCIYLQVYIIIIMLSGFDPLFWADSIFYPFFLHNSFFVIPFS